MNRLFYRAGLSLMLLSVSFGAHAAGWPIDTSIKPDGNSTDVTRALFFEEFLADAQQAMQFAIKAGMWQDSQDAETFATPEPRTDAVAQHNYDNYDTYGKSGNCIKTTGLASYYGPGFVGRRTASGEIFRAGPDTAAHRTLPFGTRVRVTSHVSHRSIVVRINDRGPFVGGRIIDLAEGAARLIHLDNVSMVTLETCF